MKAKAQALRLQRRQSAHESMVKGGGRMDSKPRSRVMSGGYRRPGSPKQSG
jgi:hypothetical protein